MKTIFYSQIILSEFSKHVKGFSIKRMGVRFVELVKIEMLKYLVSNYNIKIGLSTILVVLMLGCEDVIIVELNSADPATVIEATISDDNLPSRVTITKSTDFYTPGVYPTVTGATISVNDSKGNSYLFNEVTSGVYENLAITGKSNVEYSIIVIAEGKIYNAISKMPNKLILDSLTLEEHSSRPNKDGGRALHIYFQDQPGIADYCRIILYKNGVKLSGFSNIYSDKLTDGNYINYKLRTTEKDNIKFGDTITVKLQSIDKATFEFYKTANGVNASGSGGRGPGSTSAAPANPVTNWSNNALGLFSAYSISKRTIIIKK